MEDELQGTVLTQFSLNIKLQAKLPLSFSLDKTEIFDGESWSTSTDPPGGLLGHCMAQLKENKILLLGSMHKVQKIKQIFQVWQALC